MNGLADFDDPCWVDAVWATLLFIVQGDQVLLIHKKRGHGRGKVNAPGGKVEKGETPLACAVRETREEVGLDVGEVRPVADLRFHDTDGSRMWGFVYVAAARTGAPQETEEARPFWCSIDALPFDDMWDDDRLWLPKVLAGDCVRGEFLMHQDRLVAHALYDVNVQTLIQQGSVVKR